LKEKLLVLLGSYSARAIEINMKYNRNKILLYFSRRTFEMKHWNKNAKRVVLFQLYFSLFQFCFNCARTAMSCFLATRPLSWWSQECLYRTAC